MTLLQRLFLLPLLVCLLLYCTAAAAEKAADPAKGSATDDKAGGAICYHGSSGFIVGPPQGWKNDRGVAEQFGICMMLIPADRNFDDAPVIMYPKVTPRLKGENPVEEQVQFVLTEMRARPGGEAVTARPGPDITSESGLLFTTRYFDRGPAPNSFEMVAYSLTEDTLFFTVLSARTDQEREAAIPVLREFLVDVALLQVEQAPQQ